MNRLKKIVVIPTLLIIFFVAVSAKNSDFGVGKNLEILFNTIKGINLYYVDTIDNDKITKAGIDAMLSNLDPYTQFFTEEEMKDFETMTTGKYAGLGSAIRKPYDGDYIVFDEITEGFPVYKSEIQPGDSIMAVDGVDMKGAEAATVSGAMRGAPDTEVTLTVKSIKDGSIKDYKLKRETITISPINYAGMLNDSIAYIGFTTFSEGSGKLFREQFAKLKKEHNPKGLIIDLRSNGGGIIDEAVTLVSSFVPKNSLITSLRGRDNQLHREYFTKEQPIDTKIPLVVLINSQSASASEIVSGSIQDLDRGAIVGNRSVGKGLAQKPQDVGYGSMVKITIAKYYIPSGRCIQAVDYSHKNSDGSANKIIDSLRNKFLTKSGRTVLDGGGIEPDVNVEAEYLNIFSASLIARGYISDFANSYFAKNPTTDNIRNIEIDDETYNQFKESVANKTIEFTSMSENYLERLKSTSKTEDYYNKIKDELEAIEKVLKARDAQKHLTEEKKHIKEILALELAARYGYTRGRTELAIQDDEYVAKANEILSNKTKYDEIFKIK